MGKPPAKTHYEPPFSREKPPLNHHFLYRGGVQIGDGCFEVAFGLPWSYEQFMAKAAANFCKLIPDDLPDAIDFQVHHSLAEIS